MTSDPTGSNSPGGGSWGDKVAQNAKSAAIAVPAIAALIVAIVAGYNEVKTAFEDQDSKTFRPSSISRIDEVVKKIEDLEK